MSILIKPFEDEPIDRAIKRFIKKVKKSEILEEVYNRKSYVKPSIKEKQKRKNAKIMREKAKRKEHTKNQQD